MQKQERERELYSIFGSSVPNHETKRWVYDKRQSNDQVWRRKNSFVTHIKATATTSFNDPKTMFFVFFLTGKNKEKQTRQPHRHHMQKHKRQGNADALSEST